MSKSWKYYSLSISITIPMILCNRNYLFEIWLGFVGQSFYLIGLKRKRVIIFNIPLEHKIVGRGLFPSVDDCECFMI